VLFTSSWLMDGFHKVERTGRTRSPIVKKTKAKEMKILLVLWSFENMITVSIDSTMSSNMLHSKYVVSVSGSLW